jgi:hypothetical protein
MPYAGLPNAGRANSRGIAGTLQFESASVCFLGRMMASPVANRSKADMGWSFGRCPPSL